MHYYAPHSVTNWKHRKNALCDHIVELNADLVCLQEVSSYSLKKVFQSSLRKVGYELVGYSPARKHGHQPPTHNLHETIGSAIFMKLQKFDVVERRRILLRDFAGPVLGDEAATGEPSVHSKLLSNFRSKHQSMQIARLRVKATDQQFVIATTHLCWNPDQTDVKLLQAFAATQALRAFMAKQNLDQVATGHKHTKYGSTDAQDEEEDLADEAENEERATPDEDESPDPPVHSVEVTPAASSSNAAADEALHLLSPEEIDAFVANIPLIFCGDFNSFPNVEDESASASTNIPPSSSPSTIRSGVMQLLSSGSVPSSHPHHPNQWREMLRQKIVNAAAAASATTTTTATAATATETSPTTEQQTTQSTSPAQSVDPLSLSLPSLQQPFKLKNIYEIEPFTQYQPRFSTKTDAFQGWIDHMWCSSHFTVEMVLRLPVTTKESEEEAKNFPPIPTKVRRWVTEAALCVCYIRLTETSSTSVGLPLGPFAGRCSVSVKSMSDNSMELYQHVYCVGCDEII